jgi:hypothetical protein
MVSLESNAHALNAPTGSISPSIANLPELIDLQAVQSRSEGL